MKTLLLGAAFAVALSPAVAQPREDPATIERLRRQLSETEERLELFKRMIPAAFDPATERAWIDRFANRAKVSPIAVKIVPGSERVRLRDGQPAPIEINRLEIGGRGPYGDVHFFLSLVRTRAPLTGVESLVMEAGPGQSVRFDARLSFFSLAETPAEAVTRTDVVTALRERVARTRAIEETITATVARAQEHRIIDSLAAFTEELEKEAVALTSVRIDDALSIDGFLLGSAARNALQRGLDKGKLNASRFERSPAGVCESFNITARRAPADDLDPLAGSGFTPGKNVFDAQSIAFCRAEPKQPVRKVVAGDPNDPAFFLRLRDFDLVDVFFVLNDLLDEDFLIDGDVSGRVDLDIDGKATLDEALRALAGTGHSVGQGPLRRVSRGGAAKPVAAGSGGEPVSFSFRDADLASVLCVSSQLSGREILIPGETREVVRLFATDVPLGVIIAALTPEASGSAVDACEAPGMPPRSRLWTNANESAPAIGDLRVAGIARAGDQWKAYAYAPGGRLVTIEAGDKFADGSAEGVTPAGVVFAAAAGGKIERRLSRP